MCSLPCKASALRLQKSTDCLPHMWTCCTSAGAVPVQQVHKRVKTLVTFAVVCKARCICQPASCNGACKDDRSPQADIFGTHSIVLATAQLPNKCCTLGQVTMGNVCTRCLLCCNSCWLHKSKNSRLESCHSFGYTFDFKMLSPAS